MIADPYVITAASLAVAKIHNLMSVREAAAAYRARGLAIGKIARGSKRPTYKDWQLSSLEPANFQDGDLVCILTGRLSGDLVCVDLDSLQALEQADRYLPPTDMVSGRPGKPRSHRCYRVQSIPPQLISRAAKGMGGPMTCRFRAAESRQTIVEILGTGAQAVAPPSAHPSGEQRIWHDFRTPALIDCCELYHAVEQLAVACGYTPRVSERLAGDPHQNGPVPFFADGAGRVYYDGLPDMKQRVRRARAYIDQVDPAVAGRGGHDQTFFIACLLVRDFAVDPTEAWPLIRRYNALCQPPWSAPELQHKLEDADKFAGPRGCKLLENLDNRLRPVQADEAIVVGVTTAGVAVTASGADAEAAAPTTAVDIVSKSKHPEVSPADPFRLADHFLRETGTWRFWRGEYWRWDGFKYVRIPVEEVKACLTRSIEELFTIDWRAQYSHRANAGKKDVKRCTTPSVVNSALNAVASRTVVNCEIEMPVWLGSFGTAEKRQLIAMQNGLLDVDALLAGRDGALQPLSSDWFSANCMPYRYDPAATCPKWDQAIRRIVQDDPERIALLQEWFGYNLFPGTSLQKFMMLYGEGNNGKSVVCAALTAMLGDGNVSNVPLENFADRFSLNQSLGKLANVVTEIGEIDKAAEGKLKAYVSGDRMMFDRKGIEPIEATPTAKLLFATNNLPRFVDRSKGLWRRLILMPFEVEISKADRVLGMDTAAWWVASGDLQGILNWAIIGLERLRRNGGFTESAVCNKALADFRQESNPAGIFLANTYTAVADDERIAKSEVYKAYQTWCEENGCKALGAPQLGREVKRQFPAVKSGKTHGRCHGERVDAYVGLVIRRDQSIG